MQVFSKQLPTISGGAIDDDMTQALADAVLR